MNRAATPFLETIVEDARGRLANRFPECPVYQARSRLVSPMKMRPDRQKRARDTGSPTEKTGLMSACDASEIFIDIRRIFPRMRRHPLIFAAFEDLKHSEALVLVNDHEPWPLLYQFSVRHPGAFVWHYEEEGPDVWRFRITRGA